jgi:hypothetical protein
MPAIYPAPTLFGWKSAKVVGGLAGSSNGQLHRLPDGDSGDGICGAGPHPWQSGSSVRGKPHIGHSGHARLRQALYIAAVSSLRCNPVLRTFYGRLKAAGKASKVALCAVARKLLHLAWAIVTKQHTFDPDYGHPNSVERAS